MHFIKEATAIERTLLDHAMQTRTPISGSIELTPICNMSCEICTARLSQREVDRQGRLRTVGEWLDIARQMRDAGTLFLQIIGGEPLTYPDFKRLYLGLIDLGMLITVNTNGTLIDEEWAAFFGEHPPRRINVSLFGADEETYSSQCHYRGGFESTVRGVRLLHEHGVDVRINISVAQHNVQDISRMIAVAKWLRVPSRLDTYMVPVNRGHSLTYDMQLRLSPEDAAQARIQALKEKMSEKKFTQYVKENIWASQHILPDPVPNKMRCLAGSCSFSINWLGQMRPCAMMTQPSANTLSIGFDAAWQYIRAEVNKITLSSKCASCRLRMLCRTCAASAMLETGSCDGTPEYLCRYTSRSMELLLEEAQALSEGKA
ncbi:MAG: radical SAM protein [Clostridiales bacterium]|nr:radical SAM protein [Clostridiales bacterium]